MSLKASRTLSKMDDISGVFAGDDDDCGCSWLGLVSLMTFWVICICPEEAMFKIWLKSVEFEGIKIQEPSQRWMTYLEFLLELMMIVDVPDWGWCPWWRFGWSAYALRKPCLKFGWNLLSLKASRTLSKMDDISGVFAGVDDDCGCSWLGLISLMMFWMVWVRGGTFQNFGGTFVSVSSTRLEFKSSYH